MKIKLLKFTKSIVLDMEILSWTILFLFTAVMPNYSHNNHSVNGKVLDINNEPLIGVTVLEVGTTNGTVTDFNGNYSINVKSGLSYLRFTYIGFEDQQENVENRSTLDIVLTEETSVLDELVVVGFGTQKRVNLTSSIAFVQLDEKIASRAVTSLSTALSGQLPGLAISQNSGMAGRNDVSMLIRGMGTVNNANPLIVVDGMPDVDMNRLNVNDVESVTILKDASSAAIYGSRASNGVILITTKSGVGQERARVEFSSNFTVSRPTDSYNFLADYHRSLNLHQIAQSSGTARENYNFKDGTIDQWLSLVMIDPLRFPNTVWWDIIVRNGIMQNYNLSASGSNDKSNFFVSVGIMDEQGLQINNDYRRYNARFNYDYLIRDNLKIGTRFGGNWSIWDYFGSEGFTQGSVGTDLRASIAGVTPYDPETGYYGEEWSYPQILVEAPLSHYSNFRHRLTIDRKGRLFVSYGYWSTYWFYRNDRKYSERTLLMSSDGGQNWKLVLEDDIVS